MPAWTRRRTLRNGRQVVERAALDLQLEAPPEAPKTWVDCGHPFPSAPTHRGGAATENGYAAARAEEEKHGRYPPGRADGKLEAFAQELYGRFGDEALNFLRRAAGRACTRTSALAVLGEEGPPVVLGSWLQKLSCALQKNYAAALRAAVGAAATWADPAEQLPQDALDLLALAEHLAASAA